MATQALNYEIIKSLYSKSTILDLISAFRDQRYTDKNYIHFDELKFFIENEFNVEEY